jgi:hypothetical protein
LEKRQAREKACRVDRVVVRAVVEDEADRREVVWAGAV